MVSEESRESQAADGSTAAVTEQTTDEIKSGGLPNLPQLTPEQIAAANVVLLDEPVEGSDELDDEGEIPDASILYGDPFEPRSFGGELVWARGQHFVAKILRVRAEQQVKVAGQRRSDMYLLLTGGRAVVEELTAEGEANRVELQPARAFPVDVNRVYRLIALTDIELFTVYTEISS